MNKLTNIILGLLGVAVIGLYVLHFTANNGTETAMAPASNSTKGSIAAYVNVDSLEKNYAYFKVIKKELETKTSGMDADMRAKQKRLETKVAAYQQSAATMTDAQRQQTEQQLMMEEQELQKYAQNLGIEAQNQQIALNEKLFDKVAANLKTYCAKKNIAMVFSYTKGSSILYGDTALDITNDVIKLLNEAEKEK